MKHNVAFNIPFPSNESDRRRAERYDTALPVSIRLLSDGTPIGGSGTEVGPNGMRILTSLALAEATYVHISFETASNSTFCEGRVVWTRPVNNGTKFESGVDIQRWGGDTPEPPPPQNFPNSLPKKDRRRSRR